VKGLARLARRAVLTRLKAHAGLTALVPATNIYRGAPLVEPDWPFIRLDRSNSIPIKAACLDGATVTFPLHAFARARQNGSGALVETAEDHVGRIGAEIEKALDDKGETITVSPGVTARLTYRLTDIQPDGIDQADSTAAHYVCTVRARAVAA
jgi:hypothetical protein